MLITGRYGTWWRIDYGGQETLVAGEYVTFLDVGDLWVRLDRALHEGLPDFEVRPCLVENLPAACLSTATAYHPAKEPIVRSDNTGGR